MDNGGSVTQLGNNMYSNSIFRFNGPSHEEGGIPINYKGNQVEVEGDETGYIDSAGDLTVFGNLYVPRTNKKFKTVSKDIAKAEDKATSRIKYAADAMNKIKWMDDPMEQLSANSASVVGKSAFNQHRKATEAKENLSKLQDQMLNYSQMMGVEPKSLFGKADKGKKLKPRYPMLGPLEDNYIDYDNGFVPNYGDVPVQAPTNQLGYNLGNPIQGVRAPSSMKDISRQLTKPTDKLSVETTLKRDNNWYFPPTTSRTYDDRLGIGQILPELYTLATNKKEFVPSQSYNPRLSQSYQVSFQDRLNQNDSTFRNISQVAGNNPAALSQLAAQKYNADQGVLGEQFRANQSIQNQITNRNIDIINQAQMTNIGLNREATQAREQNLAATRATNRAALTSIAGKSEQMKQYNRGLALYNQLIPHYGYDEQTGTWNFDGQGPSANINIPGFSGPLNEYVPPYGESRSTNYNRDSKGRVINKRENRTPGFMKIFKQ